MASQHSLAGGDDDAGGERPRVGDAERAAWLTRDIGLTESEYGDGFAGGQLNVFGKSVDGDGSGLGMVSEYGGRGSGTGFGAGLSGEPSRYKGVSRPATTRQLAGDGIGAVWAEYDPYRYDSENLATASASPRDDGLLPKLADRSLLVWIGVQPADFGAPGTWTGFKGWRYKVGEPYRADLVGAWSSPWQAMSADYRQNLHVMAVAATDARRSARYPRNNVHYSHWYYAPAGMPIAVYRVERIDRQAKRAVLRRVAWNDALPDPLALILPLQDNVTEAGDAAAPGPG